MNDSEGHPSDALVEDARELARSFSAAGLRRAHEILDRAEVLLEEHPDSQLSATLLHVRGYAFLRQGRQARAEEALVAAERAFHTLGHPGGEARVLDTLGMLWERRGDRERATLLLARAHMLKQQAGDMEGIAITLGNLGRLALHGGSFHEAEEFFLLDLVLARSQDDRRGEAMVLTNLAECSTQAGNLEQAEDYARQAAQIARELGDPVPEGFADLSLADVARAAGDLDAASGHVDSAIARFEHADVPAGLAHARLRRARILAAAERPEESARAALGAARAARQANSPDLAIESLLEAHRSLLACDAPGRARRCLRRAQETAMANGLTELVQRVRATQRGHAARQAAAGTEIRVDLELVASSLAHLPGEALELRVEAVLGQGAFALVVLVQDVRTGDRYALKRLLHDAERLRSVETRLRREFTAMARIPTDALVVQPLGFGHEDGQPCLLMEYVEPRGRIGSMAVLLEETGTLDPDLVARLGADIARGLAAIHACGVVHRDLKPGNVLLDRDGRARLADHGLAYDLNEDGYVPEGGFKGSIGFAAPELFRVEGDSWAEPRPVSDLYSLGVLLFRALRGDWPFEHDGSVPGILRGKLAGPPTVDQFRGIPDGLARVVRGLLEPDPEFRTASAASVAETLDGWIEEGSR